MNNAVIAHQPESPARHLALLFHGVGATPEGMLPLARVVAQARPDALVLCVRSPDPSDFGGGWQWFSVRGIDEENRPGRVAGAMPRFVKTIRHWQAQTGLEASSTSLIGFSQGSIMSLEATQSPEALAGRVIAVAGRFAAPPRLAPPDTVVHLIHGRDDAVIDPACSVSAAEQLRALGASADAVLVPALGHAIDARVCELVAERMRD